MSGVDKHYCSSPIFFSVLVALLIHSLIFIIPVPGHYFVHPEKTKVKTIELQLSLFKTAGKHSNSSSDSEMGQANAKSLQKNTAGKAAKQLTTTKKINKRRFKAVSGLTLDGLLASVKKQTLASIEAKARQKSMNVFEKDRQLKPQEIFTASDLFKKYNFTKVSDFTRADGSSYVVLHDKTGKRRCFIVKPDRVKELAENLWYIEKCKK